MKKECYNLWVTVFINLLLHNQMFVDVRKTDSDPTTIILEYNQSTVCPLIVLHNTPSWVRVIIYERGVKMRNAATIMATLAICRGHTLCDSGNWWFTCTPIHNTSADTHTPTHTHTRTFIVLRNSFHSVSRG